MILVNSKNSFPQMVVFLLCSSMFPHFSKYCFVWFLLIFFFYFTLNNIIHNTMFFEEFLVLVTMESTGVYVISCSFVLWIGNLSQSCLQILRKKLVEIHWLMMQVKIIKIEGWRSCYVIGTNKGLEDFSYRLLYSLFLFLLIFGWHHQLINMCSK